MARGTDRRPLRFARPAGSAPARILVLSADMGEGHDAAARAIEEQAHRLWPQASIHRLDTLQVMGPGVGPVFRRIYVANVQTTPWLYEFFYAALWRFRWFAEASKRFVGAWCGRALAPQLDRMAPDLVITTYPLATAGMAWLRRHRRTTVPTAAWVTDFAPHPFWVYDDIDLTLVLHEQCLAAARRAEPRARLRVGALPVTERFRTAGDAQVRAPGRAADGLLQVLVSCGSLGFGAVDRAVDAALTAGSQVRVRVVCGRNEPLRRRLAARADARLAALGWVSDMPGLLAGSDVVVSNAGGATALEAWAAGRPVVMVDPIAAHGRGNAELMAAAGLSVTCETPAELTAHLRGLLAEPGRLGAAADRVRAYAESADLADDLGHVATLATPGIDDGRPPASPDSTQGALSAPGPTRGASPGDRVRAQDAFFLHVETPHVPQQIGALLRLGPVDGAPVRLSAVRAVVESRLPGLPSLRRRLAPGRSAWARPRWAVDEVDLDRHVTSRVVPADGLAGAVDEFFSSALPRDRPLWHVQLLEGLPGNQTALVVKLHHVLGDGLSAIGTLDRLLDPVGAPRPLHALAKGRQATFPRADARRIACGLGQLARHGTAGASGLSGEMSTSMRHLVTAQLDLTTVRATARGLGVRTSELLLTLFADGLSRIPEIAATAPTIRAMVPFALRSDRAAADAGNWTGAISADLPVAAMSPADRLRMVRTELAGRLRGGEPYAARAVMLGMGVLPFPLHGLLARGTYRRTWFNAIVSYIPGVSRPRQLAGAGLVETYPVLPLAEGVGLAAGLLSWSGDVGVGITVDPTLVPSADRLPAALRAALAAFAEAAAVATPAPA